MISSYFPYVLIRVGGLLNRSIIGIFYATGIGGHLIYFLTYAHKSLLNIRNKSALCNEAQVFVLGTACLILTWL